jgi:DNA-binding MarR family transcriptional regulator
MMEIDQKQIRALAGFRSALRRFLVFSEEATRKEGVTAQQYQAILAIKAQPHGSVSIGELAEELLLKSNAAVQLVDRLAKLGLVKRQRSKASERVVLVQLTDAGESVLLRLAALHLEQLSRRKKQWADIVRQLKGIHSN